MERDYKEDQKNEVVVLDSIYCGDMEILETEPFYKMRIPIATVEFENGTNGLACHLIFTYGEKYPDEAPLVEIEGPVNFEDSYEKLLLDHIKTTISEHIGMEMIFPLVSSAQEWLNVRWDEYKQKEEDAKGEKILEVEPEQKKFKGTPVNVETFKKWRNQFELDMGIAARREKELLDGKKLTGKELFLGDKTLNQSDMKFLVEAGDSIENVKMDESVSQNFGDSKN